MDTKNYTQVLIDGKIYTLGGSEDEAYLQKAASYVNEKITTMHALPGFSKQSADYQQLMLLLNIADDYFKTKETADQMEEQRDRMEKETYSLKHELVSSQGLTTVVLAHITFCTPYVVLSVMPRLKQMNQNIYEAALDLGATPFQALRKVIFPEIRPGMISGFILAFTLSIDDFAVTIFTSS